MTTTENAASPAETSPVGTTVDADSSVGTTQSAASPVAKKRRGRLAAVMGSVALAAALIAGVGYTVVTVRDADRHAGAPEWRFPQKEARKKTAAAPKGLAGMLVPYGTESWTPGPDMAEYGADVQLSGAQATALRKESLRALPRSQRQRLEQQIDRQRIKGMAMRSYFSAAPGGDGDETIYTVRVQLAQMGSQAAVRDMAKFQGAFFDALDVLRDGPAVKGHKNAKCFLSPEDADEEIDYLFCSAYAGDVLVTVTAEGAKPLDTKAVAALLTEQLDRIAGQGEAV
ncbi:hypothetical protein [Streptomyces sp. NPDC049915]|uniref:hypothetical protein n=1 Tax=Streptomyces sp. NPDC049915 TaxID=3155510 RepID=UPI00342E24F0